MSQLTVVPTPVGNMSDMTERALQVLRSASFVMAEDTRTTSVLFKRFNITTPLISYHKFNEHEVANRYVDRIEAGEEAALVSDAGTPAISDPGYLIVARCIERGVKVSCLPGATAFVPALVMSGLPCDRFSFEGFLPNKKGRASALAALANEKRTMIFYESPFRLVKTLQQMAEVFGSDRPASVSREVSKVFEETVRGTLTKLAAHFDQTPPKGEIVLIVGGVGRKTQRDEADSQEDDVDAEPDLKQLRRSKKHRMAEKADKPRQIDDSEEEEDIN